MNDQQKYNRLVGFLCGENSWEEIWEGEETVKIPEVIISELKNN